MNICGSKHESHDVTGIVCEMPAGHSGHEHGTYVWSGWYDDSDTTVIGPDERADNSYSVNLDGDSIS
jgi:hypothetical protein